ncbi:MAG TPA: SBBP repeat-containing protein, partial [Thermoanaerobaculia bacterium]|nr:SBBP repeat-containing protein [Thermoanaerobaculia bacterium]
AADSTGSAYVVGATNSSDFPTRNAAQPALRGGGGDAFILRVTSDGSALVWSTYLGGSSGDWGMGIALGREGSVYVTGVTGSSDFPTRNALQPAISSPDPNADAFVVRLTPDGSLVYSTYLGSSELEWGNDVAVDAQGSAWVMGFTESTDFPVREPFQAECRPASGTYCSPDLFLAQLTPAGDALVQASYLGGTYNEENAFIAIDPAGFVSIAGWTTSLDFPTVRAFQPSPPGGMLNGFVLRMAPANRPPDCSAPFASPSTLWPPNGRMVPVSIRGVTDPDGDPVTLRVTAIRQDEPLSRKRQPDATGLGTATPRLRADRVGNGDGRVYHIAFEATDPAGAACTGTVTVCVPHDQGKPACGDGGALVDSIGATR